MIITLSIDMKMVECKTCELTRTWCFTGLLKGQAAAQGRHAL